MIYSCLSLLNDVSTISITRAIQLELLKNKEFHGDLLDYGGGDNAQYRKYIKSESYSSANIDSNIRPTWVISIGEKIPCNDLTFENVLSLNTLEHVYNTKDVLKELYRVLKINGEICISTPFMFGIHGHPDDFFRPTPSWYQKSLSSVGFRDVKVLTLSVGPFSTGASCSGLPGPAKVFRMRCAIVLDYIYHYSRKLLGKKDISSDSAAPLALWVVARK
jgi:SAM-dependent methyltransferase